MQLVLWYFLKYKIIKDQTAKLWDVDSGKEIATLRGHSGEIVSLHFNAEGDKILTGSFDRKAIVNEINNKIRSGILDQANAFMYWMSIQERSLALNSNLLGNSVLPVL